MWITPVTLMPRSPEPGELAILNGCFQCFLRSSFHLRELDEATQNFAYLE